MIPARLKAGLVAGAGGAALTALLKTCSWEINGAGHYRDSWGRGKPVIFVLWHGRLMPCSFYHRGQQLATLISQHRDGDYIAGIVEGWWGFTAIRGSSSRGGSLALRNIVRTLKAGTAVAVTPDGPRGPRERMKPGPLLAARMAGVPLIPVSAGANRAWWVQSWDRFLVPKPFSRIRLEYGEPVMLSAKADEREMDDVSTELEHQLAALTARVDDWSADAIE
jgi:lysophospholipid acyltransferase (LPLAT)-like uncharacterized protein